MKMEMKLDKNNIAEELKDYLIKVNSIELPEWKEGDVLGSLLSLKRDLHGSGPYPDVSLFEASNRVFSDLVILFGVRKLLTNPPKYNFSLPFTEYKVKLGVTDGFDLEANLGRQRLIGEAFNVAPSFFQSKKRKMMKKLKEEKADYKLIIFNHDAPDKNEDKSEYYVDKSKQSLFYLPINVGEELKSNI